MSQTYDELVSINKNISKEINEIRKGNSGSSTFTEFKTELNLIKQFNIRTNIVIKGIYIKKDDDPLEIFMRLVKHLADVYETDIEKAYIKENSNSTTLFINFFEYKIKKLFTNSRKGRRITPSDIYANGQNFIIIEDQLIKENSKLLKESKVVLN